jgi:hypothetical protein
MIASVHVADVGAPRLLRVLRHNPSPGRTPGLVYADLLAVARLGPRLLPRIDAGLAGLFAVWDDDAALDRFLAADRLGETLAAGRGVRLEPLRVAGRWTGLPSVAPVERSIDDHAPVAVVTYGRLRLRRTVGFLRASARAEADAVAHPGLLDAIGLARPPRLVSTFSLWSTAAAMHDFAHRGRGHTGALRAVAERDFHHESTFLRFRPYAATGAWGDALAPRRPPGGDA